MVVGLRFLFWVEGQSCGRALRPQSRLVPFCAAQASRIAWCCPDWSTGFLRSNGAAVVRQGFIGRVGPASVSIGLQAGWLSRLLVRLSLAFVRLRCCASRQNTNNSYSAIARSSLWALGTACKQNRFQSQLLGPARRRSQIQRWPRTMTTTPTSWICPSATSVAAASTTRSRGCSACCTTKMKETA